MDAVVAGELGGPHERHFAADGEGAVRNRELVGRQDEAIENPGLQRRFNRVGDERLARERLEVLSRNPLRSAARGDDAQDSWLGAGGWGLGAGHYLLGSLEP